MASSDFTATPLTGYAPLSVQFTDQSDPGTLTWLWDFGDTVTSTEQNPTHTYTYPGWFTVSLTVTDSLGSDTKTEEHYIKANLVVREQKYNYIFVTPTLKTYDIAPPENRLDLRYARKREKLDPGKRHKCSHAGVWNCFYIGIQKTARSHLNF